MTSYLCLLILSSLALSSQLGLENIFYSPQDQTVREGKGVFFQCVSGESSPPAHITWLKDGTLVRRGRQVKGVYGGGHQEKTSGTLHLFNVTLEDDGIYVCVTHNPLLNISKRSRPAKLNVIGVPKTLHIIRGPDNITVAQATEVSMHCTVSGFPVPMVHWFKDGCLMTNSSASFSLRNNGQLLTITNVTKEDEGWYHCEAFNQEESVKSHPAFLLSADMGWSFVQHPTNMTVMRGENVTVTCRPPSSRPPAQVSWFKNNRLFIPTDHVTVLTGGDLFFQSIQEDDSGSYFCRASNPHLQRFLTSQRATLTVQAPPLVKVWPRVLAVPPGARVKLECNTSGHPLPSISWLKKGRSKQTGGRIVLGLRNITLYIESARIYDEGEYVCIASNTLGQSHDAAVLTVAVSPIIVTFLNRVSSLVGALVVLPCQAVGIEPITYIWTRGGAEAPISPAGDRHTAADGALHIYSVQQSDAGEYYCTAENRAGRHQRRSTLTITAEHPPGDRDEQTTPVLSTSTVTNAELPVSQSRDFDAEEELKTTSPSDTLHNTCSSQLCDATTSKVTTHSKLPREAVEERQMPLGSFGHLLQHNLNQPKPNPTQPLITQLQPPLLPPPPHPKLKLAFSSQMLDTTVQYMQSERQPHLELLSTLSKSQGESFTQTSDMYWTFSAEKITDSLTERLLSQPESKFQVQRGFAVLKSELVTLEPTQSFMAEIIKDKHTSHSVTKSIPPSERYQTESQPLLTKRELYQPLHKPTPTQGEHKRDTQWPFFASVSEKPEPQQLSTQRVFPKFYKDPSNLQNYLPYTQIPSATETQQSVINSEQSPMQPEDLTLTLPEIKTSPSAAQPSQTQEPLPHKVTAPLQHSSLQTQSPVTPFSTSNGSSKPSTLNHDGQFNISQRGGSVKPASDKDWRKSNTSQSPMTSNDPRATQQSPSWLPVMEKHDIPIVVGVGVSLAFIFITVFFYSVVQKNQPVPPNRAAQRNLGVPLRHAESRAAGRTYENRAFEDDDCLAVIEHCPNTSARPPGPSLVTVQMEPTSMDLQGDPGLAPDSHSVTVETYSEPLLDTKVDPSLEDCSLSQPSIQLQCSEDWTSQRGDSCSPCQDALPPPSSISTCSPSPSPPSRLEEGLHSSLTLQVAEACTAPIHHSLSISHGNPPLLLSHHISLGPTTVAVDVHFYPTATVTTAASASTQTSSVTNSTSLAPPLFSPPLVKRQENHSQFK